ncbi:hypothetical protein MMZ06_00065 [Burkholderia gladioli]|uniref:hypothetical protein n=1 Tax=Burkholderia gladioli TaxID=28095 RepID=UPI001F4A2387|nr:hypothetical protein [Burkholderia gladioli]MCH7268237.1 hypothetical protein [Burkholderia gladioli]MEB2548812.1 hypothetical protein [Burkholderia gladioli]
MSLRHWAFVLAASATSTALCLSILAGWQRGGSLPERLVWVAMGVVLVISAHLLPALLREVPILLRHVGSLLWVACLAAACFGHVQFFVTAQRHAGEQRAAVVQVATPPSSMRSLTAVMAERATVTAQLATAKARVCVGICATLEARRATLAARLDALNAEADDIRRQQRATDHVTAQRDSLLADPVTARLAALLGVATARMDLLSGLMFAAVLEGAACLLWAIAFRAPTVPQPAPARSAPLVMKLGGEIPSEAAPGAIVTEVTQSAVTPPADSTLPTITPVQASRVGMTVSCESATHRHGGTALSSVSLPVAPIDELLAQLTRDVAAGLVRPTVSGIRLHLRCSQARAITLRRQLAQLDITA